MPTPEERAEKKRLAAEAKTEAKRIREQARRAKAAEYLRGREEKLQERLRNRIERSFNFVIAGLSHEDRYSRVIQYCHEGDEIDLQREPNHPYDPNAVRILAPGGHEIGFAPRYFAEEMAPLLDEGKPYFARCTKILGGRMGPAPVVDVHVYGKEATLPGLRFAELWKGTTPERDPGRYRLAPHGPQVDRENRAIGWAVLIILCAALLFAARGC
jgi:HIRAN domain